MSNIRVERYNAIIDRLRHIGTVFPEVHDRILSLLPSVEILRDTAPAYDYDAKDLPRIQLESKVQKQLLEMLEHLPKGGDDRSVNFYRDIAAMMEQLML